MAVSIFLVSALAMAANKVVVIPLNSSSPVYVAGTEITALPYTITEPGMYFITDNLTDVTNGEGILITANDVTLDLMGFTLTGTGTAHYGIEITGTNSSIANGTIKAFGQAGVYTTKTQSRATDIRAIENGTLGTTVQYSGIALSGRDAYIERCLSVSNGGHGIATGTNYDATIINNIVRDNGNDGIYVGKASLVDGNIVKDNTQWGIEVRGNSTIVHNNIITGNNSSDTADQGGLRVYQNDQIIDNLLTDNNQNNIYVASGTNFIERNVVANGNSLTGEGIHFVSDSNYYANNKARHNSTNYAGTVPTGSYDGGNNVSLP